MPVCIAGMHRSGTSMVTNFLQACGVYLGPVDEIMPAAPENPEGFWENFTFVEINEEILNQLGGGWDCPPPPPDDWTTGPLAPVAAHAESILERFAGREPWGWKDPRNCLTIPFWQTFFPEMRVVIVVRNPLEVAHSLRKRNGFSFALGLNLWYIAYRRVLDATTETHRIVTHYDAYFGDSRPEILRVTEFLKLPAPGATSERLTSASTLRHHQSTTEDLLAAEVAPALLALYRDLCEEAEWRDSSSDSVRVTRPEMHTDGTAASDAERMNPFAAGVGGIHRATMQAQEEVVQIRDKAIARLTADLDALRDRYAQLDHQRFVVEQEAGALQRTINDQVIQLNFLWREMENVRSREAELRSHLTSAHEQLVHRDSEFVGSLGAALYKHAPGAPAAIYYRQLLTKVREIVATHLPATARLLVVNTGDEAMLELNGKQALPFPREASDGVAAYRDIDDDTAIAQLDQLQREGAEYLVVPASALAWLARHPDLKRHLNETFPIAQQDAMTVTIYALAPPMSAPA